MRNPSAFDTAVDKHAENCPSPFKGEMSFLADSKRYRRDRQTAGRKRILKGRVEIPTARKAVHSSRTQIEHREILSIVQLVRVVGAWVDRAASSLRSIRFDKQWKGERLSTGGKFASTLISTNFKNFFGARIVKT